VIILVFVLALACKKEVEKVCGFGQTCRPSQFGGGTCVLVCVWDEVHEVLGCQVWTKYVYEKPNENPLFHTIIRKPSHKSPLGALLA
jgi:hypothetical protein